MTSLQGWIRKLKLAGWFAFPWILGACASGDPEAGREAYERHQCGSCHESEDESLAPRLEDVGRKYSREELRLWLWDPEILYERRGERPINADFPPMPRMTLTREEIDDLVAYLRRR